MIASVLFAVTSSLVVTRSKPASSTIGVSFSSSARCADSAATAILARLASGRCRVSPAARSSWMRASKMLSALLPSVVSSSLAWRSLAFSGVSRNFPGAFHCRCRSKESLAERLDQGQIIDACRLSQEASRKIAVGAQSQKASKPSTPALYQACDSWLALGR